MALYSSEFLVKGIKIDLCWVETEPGEGALGV